MLVFFASAALASTAHAATLTVTTTADELTLGDGLCSLREAVAAVNSPGTATDCGTASNTSNTIVLPAGQYPLSIAPTGADDNSSGDLNVTGTGPLTIIGAGESATDIDATGFGDRVLSIAAGATVTLQKLDITGGHARDGGGGANGSGDNCLNPPPQGIGGGGGGGADGGGIYNAGTLSLVGVGVVGNVAGAGGSGGAGFCYGGSGGGGGGGGGIYNAGTLKVIGSAILNNNAGGGGPGGGPVGVCMIFRRCFYRGGRGAGGGGGAGGGIYNAGSAAKLTVTNSTIDGNHGGGGGAGGAGGFMEPGGHSGGGGGGGGIANQDGTLVVNRATITGNTAGYGGQGGGIAAAGGSLRVTNSTLGGNNAGNGASGGAIAATGLASASVVRNTTIANNGAGGGGSGGGLAVSAATGGHPLTLQNTIVASNNANGAANCYPSSGMANGGHDLSYGDATCPGANGNPALLPLGDYGGPTQTMALGPGSAALDQVPATGADCPKIDQRGVTRPQGPACDIGAFESVEGGWITGTVTNSATHVPLPRICVRAYDASGSVVASAQTDSSGAYTTSAVPRGSYRVGFTDCSGLEYTVQYYNDKATLGSGDPVSVSHGTTTSGIDAAMVATRASAAADFLRAPLEANPQPDSTGLGQWEFMRTNGATSPSAYVPLGSFTATGFGIPGLEQWTGSDLSTPNDYLPAIGVNATGTNQNFDGISWPEGAMRMHPSTGDGAVLAWRAGADAVPVQVTGEVRKIQVGCGPGLAWSLEGPDGSALAAGTVAGTDYAAHQFTAQATLGPGQAIYLVISAPISNVCDSTMVQLNVAPA